MIYVVEFPHQARPTAWFAFDGEDFARKVEAKRADDRTIFFVATPRQQLESVGCAPDSPGARTEYAGIFDLAERYGWDTILYRADYLLGEGVYQAEPASELDACVAAIAHGLRACRVYLSDGAAMAALYRDPLYDGREGFHAHMALREQLIALEVISDDW
jgi:hypothetical protein